jgi:hypothetical protein
MPRYHFRSDYMFSAFFNFSGCLIGYSVSSTRLDPKNLRETRSPQVSALRLCHAKEHTNFSVESNSLRDVRLGAYESEARR